jgi:integrase/recombinase XerD
MGTSSDKREATAKIKPTAAKQSDFLNWKPDLAHPHILRHSLCSTMAAQHADVYAIQQRAGHKNISNTMIYTHVSDEQASESCREALMIAFG